MKFRKKPVVIDAVQWFPGIKIDGLVDEVGADRDKSGGVWEGYAVIRTLEGVMKVSPGDWVITGVKGEKYPCKPDIFKATYEPAGK